MEIERILQRDPYNITDFRGQRISDWLPDNPTGAKVPSPNSEDAVWALARLWSESANEKPLPRRYWADLIDEAREEKAPETSGSPSFQLKKEINIESVHLHTSSTRQRFPSYDLHRLGSHQFTHLAHSLAKRILEPSCEVATITSPTRKRALTFTGQVTLRGHDKMLNWDGRGVVITEFLEDREVDSAEILLKVRNALGKFSTPSGARTSTPQYVLFITNSTARSAVEDPASVQPSPNSTHEDIRFPIYGLDDGNYTSTFEDFGWDTEPISGEDVASRLHQEITKLCERIGIKEWAVWYWDDVCRYLAMYPDIRRAYAGFITPGDVLSRLVDVLPGPGLDETAAMIRANAAKELIADQWVRLGQSGAEGDHLKISLGPVAVDLEAEVPAQEKSASPSVVHCAEYVIHRGDHILRPSISTNDDSRHVVIIGGPGQGKSTLGQLICQAYRVSLLGTEGEQFLTAAAREVLVGLRRDLQKIGLSAPRMRRWPIRVALYDYANHIVSSGDTSLLGYLALKVGRRISGTFSDHTLEEWLQAWPWLLVLDGLDEVSSPEVREMVTNNIQEFLLVARRLDTDHLILATTRPQGYHGEFHKGDFLPLQLRKMSTENARQYAARLASARHRTDPEMRETVIERFIEASRQQTTARLMATPLQVTIMCLLVEKRSRMPQNRFDLFDAYYNTIYMREVDKPGSTGQLLAENRRHIDWLHQHVGLILQKHSADSNLDSIMPEDEVRERTRSRLLAETEDPKTANTLTSALLEAATQRLVLLVSPESGYIGFEVRSLQEYMAARALISGPESDILPRLQDLACNASWRNTWLLAATGIFTQRPHLRDGLLTCLRDVDSQDVISMALAPGAHLALELLEDDLARSHPRHHKLLVLHAAALIERAPGPWTRPAAAVLHDAAVGSEQICTLLEQIVKKSVKARDARLITAIETLHRWTEFSSPLAATSRRILREVTDGLGLEERAAAVFLNLQSRAGEIPGLSLPHLVGDSPAAGRLSDFLDPKVLSLTESNSEKIRSFVRQLSQIPVHQKVVNGVIVTGVKLRPLPSVAGSDSTALMEGIAETINSQPITSWQVASSLNVLLAGLSNDFEAQNSTQISVADVG